MIELPTIKIEATRKNPRTLLLYGGKKVGKTDILSKLDDCLILDLENGTEFIKALKVQANSLEELAEICKSIRNSEHKYKYIAIDTLDRLEEWCEKSATENYKASNIGKSFTGKTVLELPMGAGYLWLRQEYMKWINAFLTLSEHIIFISHLKLTSINKGGVEVQSKDVDLTGKIKGMTCSMADAIGYLYRGKDNELRVSFKTNEEVVCGSRCDHLRGQDMEMDWRKIYV